MKCPHCGAQIISRDAEALLNHMRKTAPYRGGYMFEGARPSYEDGSYYDSDIAELLAAGLIAPHPDPAKGWIVVDSKFTP